MNKKGLTIVELLVSFVLISIVFVGIMTIIFSYRSIVTDSNYKTQLYEFKNNLTKDIYADILSRKVSNVSYVDPDERNKVKIDFADGTSKILEVDIRDLRNKKIIYGNRIYKLEDSIPSGMEHNGNVPESIDPEEDIDDEDEDESEEEPSLPSTEESDEENPESSSAEEEDTIPNIEEISGNLDKYQNIVVNSTIVLEPETIQPSDKLFKIRINIKYKDLADDYSINIVYKLD